MEQIRDFADERNKGWCVYCGGRNETRDHVPSRVLLDDPYPENLPVVPACFACNASFSKNEEYFSCLIECALNGSIETASRRCKIANIFTRSPSLVARLKDARHENEDGVAFSAEQARVRNVVVKLARGHVAFEQNEPQLDDPNQISYVPFNAMSEDQRDQFESTSPHALWPEVGSRSMIRLLSGYDLDEHGWVEVQPDQYRYRVFSESGYRVQMVVREYLAVEVAWDC